MAEAIINFDDIHAKRRLLTLIGALSGKWRMEWTRVRPRRSNAANSFYWGVVVEALRQFLHEQGEPVTAEEAHELFKGKFLRFSVMNKVTGEVVGESARSTAAMTTSEFFEYVENCRAWLAEMFGILTPEPERDDFKRRELVKHGEL